MCWNLLSARLQHLQQTALDKGLTILYGGVMKSYLNASEVARLLNVDRATITRWIRRGVIQGAQRPGGARQWRVPLSAYVTLIKHESC